LKNTDLLAFLLLTALETHDIEKALPFDIKIQTKQKKEILP